MVGKAVLNSPEFYTRTARGSVPSIPAAMSSQRQMLTYCRGTTNSSRGDSRTHYHLQQNLTGSHMTATFVYWREIDPTDLLGILPFEAITG